MKAFGKCVEGSLHENEDKILINEKMKLYAVADGVTLSSVGSGKIASEKAIEYLEKFFEGDLKKTFEKLNEKILEEKKKDRRIGETTLTAMHANKNSLQICWVGDSPAFLFRKFLTRLTLSDEILGYLTQAIGLKDIRVNSKKIKLQKNDVLLLMTDGISDVLSESEIEEIVKKSKVEEIAENLIKEAERKEKIYDDDKSVVIIHV